MRILKSHPLLKMVNSYVIDSPQPSNISYLWNFGSLLAFCLIIQIITGVTLGMHYTPNVLEAFDSVEHIMRDVNNGWLIRYLHSNTASAFFFLVYLHIGRGLYYGSYKAPRTLTWTIGTVIFILMMATAFLGYVLPYGQMSLWGATVITNLMSAIPWVGQDIVEFIWGGFSVNNATLNRFFALHFVLPFVLAALALMHLIALHDSSGSGNPLGISGNYDRLPFSPYFIFKDLITIFLFVIILSIFVFFMPNMLGDSENYVMANPMQTPPAIVPEWYLLPFYAILRSIPNKLLGVIAMFAAILILLSMPFMDLSILRGIQFRPLSKIFFFIFVANFFVLMQLGAKHVEPPFIELGQISTFLYFAYFIFIVPFITLLENSLRDLAVLETNTNNQTVSFQQEATLSCIALAWKLITNYNRSREYQTHPWDFRPVTEELRAIQTFNKQVIESHYSHGERVIEVLYHPHHGNVFVYLRYFDDSVFGCAIIERNGLPERLKTKESLDAYRDDFLHAFGSTEVAEGTYESLNDILNLAPPAVYNIAQIASWWPVV